MSGGVYLLLCFFSSILTTRDATSGEIGSGRRRKHFHSDLRPVSVSIRFSDDRLPWNETFWLRVLRQPLAVHLGRTAMHQSTVLSRIPVFSGLVV